ncbi:NAD(P)-dependent oxidoreductase [Streptomyces sp. NPDC001083]|uniref:NAD(P)-dependent oxidoreductase n=1 Tax=Streptomyces sp. NPDC001083 TaxID=3364545 RepID=UPI0036B6E4D3
MHIPRHRRDSTTITPRETYVTNNHALRNIGWIGLGDQGAPMARAIADSGYPLQVWARRSTSLDALDGLPYTVHTTVAELGSASDIVGLCLREDSDIREVLTDGGLLAAMKPGSVIVNHGTGLPQFANEMTDMAAARGIHVLDAPVSGGNAGAVARQLTTMVGGDTQTVERCRPVFETFSKKVTHMGPGGAGQLGKLMNNTLLMMNQRSVQEILGLAHDLGLDIAALVDLLRSGTGSSFALQALGGPVTTDNAEHLTTLQLIDMDIFDDAVRALGHSVPDITARAVEGARGLPGAAHLVAASSPSPATAA